MAKNAGTVKYHKEIMECSALDVVKLRKNLMLKVDRGNLNDRLESGVMQKFMLNNSIFEYIFV